MISSLLIMPHCLLIKSLVFIVPLISQNFILVLLIMRHPIVINFGNILAILQFMGEISVYFLLKNIATADDATLSSINKPLDNIELTQSQI